MLPKIYQQLDEMMQLVPYAPQRNPKISGVNAGWHIAHSMITIQKIYDSIIKTDPANYKSKHTLGRLIVLGCNYIPRGKVTSPKEVVPEHEYSLEELKQRIAQSRERLQQWDKVGAQQYFMHPVLGCLNKKPSLRFFYVHTNHHLKIIRDILRG